jgi:multidrug resistance efflux pump
VRETPAPWVPVAPDPANRAEPAPGLIQALESWRARLASAGVACRAVALHGSDPHYCVDFDDSLPDLALRWHELRAQLPAGLPPGTVRADRQPGADLLLLGSVQLPDGEAGAVGAAIAPPYTERTVQFVGLSLGWLQLALSSAQLVRGQRAGRLLDLLGHVASQTRARAAAQEWINRTAAWARDEAGDPPAAFSLMLFALRGERPRWWVTADSAWTDKASPAVRGAAELAVQCVVEQREVRQERAWAMPVLEDGNAVAALVALAQGPAELPPQVLDVFGVSLSMVEPLLRRWREAERPLWLHAWESAVSGWRRLRQPGHLAWKAGVATGALALVVVLGLPMPDRVTAPAAIEGRQRRIVTAPFEGFIGQVMVRPGERVTQGQLLARLDDRDLKLEQARFRSERDQAAGHLRQAMADHDAPAMALSLAEVQQAEAQLSLVETKLLRTELTAPAEGLVVSGDWVQQIGGPVEAGKEMFEIDSGDGWRVVLHVPDRDITRVHAGQTGALRLAGQPQVVHRFRIATVTATASVQDNVNGFRVEADWVGAVPPLSPGMQGVGKVEVGRANLLTIWTRPSIDWLRLKLWSWWW